MVDEAEVEGGGYRGGGGVGYAGFLVEAGGDEGAFVAVRGTPDLKVARYFGAF